MKLAKSSVMSNTSALRRELHFQDRVLACHVQRPPNLAALLAQAVALRPQQEALVCGQRRLNWGEVDEQARRVARALMALGVAPGDRVALLLGNEVEFVLTTLGATLAGAIVVPLNVREQAPGVHYILDHCGAKALVHEDSLAHLLPPPAAMPGLQARSFVALLAAQSASGTAPAPAAHTAMEDDVAAILYTSGTTGRPKGAMLTHLGIIHSATVYRDAFALGHADRIAAVVPLGHVTGLVALLTTALLCAATLVVVPSFKAADFLPLAARERISFTVMVPAMYSLCLMQPDFAQHDLSAWRVGAFGGAPMAPAVIDELAQRLPTLSLSNCYGATETTSPVTIMPAALTRAHLASVGLAVPGAEIVVVDDAGRECVRGESGEIWLRGAMVVPGYWCNPQATAENFSAGFWHSGDLGVIDAEGFLYVQDRKKDMLNRGGYKVFSVEVESVLAEHPDVLEAAVVGKPCPVLGERVHAFVSGKEGRTPDASTLREFCAARLADYKVPESLTIVGTPLPRNANGKLLKRQLREQLLVELGRAETAAE
jgi:long-chain acyl-CoA synthetase